MGEAVTEGLRGAGLESEAEAETEMMNGEK